MSITIESDLATVLGKIDQKLDNLQKDVTDLKIEIVGVKGEINSVRGEIKILDTKVDGLSTRMQNQEFLSRSIVGGLILIVLGGAAKMFGFV